MQARPTYLARSLVVLLIAGLLFAAGLESDPRAFAVVASGQVSVTPTPDSTRAAATYVIARFRVPNGETVTGYTVTFPVDTYARDATSPNASVSVAPDDRTVTVIPASYFERVRGV